MIMLMTNTLALFKILWTGRLRINDTLWPEDAYYGRRLYRRNVGPTASPNTIRVGLGTLVSASRVLFTVSSERTLL